MLSAELVKDINQTGAESRPTQLAKVGDRVFFAANDGTHGIELWASDGASGGTYLVKDINPGAGNSSPRSIVDINGIAYFSADDGVHGFELWKSDGTESGTVLIKDLDPSFSSGPSGFKSLNGEVYFTNSDYYTPGLWKTDGTEAGTMLVKGQDETGQSLSFGGLIRLGDELFMSGGSRTSGSGLWKSDGTSGGTVLVKQVGSPQNFHAFRGMLIFVAQTDANGDELWKSDGTDAGTLMLKDIRPGMLSGVSPYASFEDYNNFLWFSTYDGGSPGWMWKTDGTPDGTVRTANGAPSSSTQMGGYMYYVAPEGNGVSSLWKMDGAGASQFLKRFTSNPISSSNAQQLTVVGNRVLFTAPDAASGIELWSTDGTPEGTSLLKDIEPGAEGSAPNYLTALSGRALFSAHEDTVGLELWQSDGTAAGTTLLKDIHGGNLGGAGGQSVLLNDTLYFAGGSGYTEELWRSDGTEAGTTRVKGDFYSLYSVTAAAGRIYVTWGGHYYTSISASDGTEAGTYTLPVFVLNGLLGSAGNLAFLAPFDDVHGFELWKTDGTPAGTSLVKDINPGPNPSNPYVLVDFNGKLFFEADDGVHGREPWISDGTEAGTFMLADLAEGAGGSNPIGLAAANGIFLFTVRINSELLLFRTDGTVSGTQPLLDLGGGSTQYYFRQLQVMGDRVFFQVQRPGGAVELWVSDGTAVGTAKLADFGGDSWVIVGDTLYFMSAVGGSRELWRTDGTIAGTARVRTIGPGASGPGVDLGGVLIFSGNDGAHGSELWRSDGTEAGTYMIEDFNPGSASFSPSNFTRLGGWVYFVATDPVHGTELWRTDGTAAGTELVEDVFPGPIGSAPSSLRVISGKLLFTGTNPLVGRELWQADAGIPDFVVLSADADLEWGRGPDGPILALHQGTITINQDLSLAYPGISLVANNDALVHLAATQHLESIMLSDAAKLDLGAPLYILDGSSQELASLRSLIKSDRILPSKLESGAALGIGYALDAALGRVEIAPVLVGDLNLDGSVSIADFIQLASHFGQTNANWFDGDINYDDQVSIADFITLSSNFGQSYSANAASPAPAEGTFITATKSRHRRGYMHHRRRAVAAEAWSAQARRWIA